MPFFCYRRLFLLFTLMCVGPSRMTAAGEFSAPLFFSSEYRSSNDSHLKHADMLFEAGYDDNSIEAYNSIIDDPTSSQNTRSEACFHLALAYFSQKQYSSTINILLAHELNSQEDVGRNALFLLSMAYKASENHEQAIESFKRYTLLPQPPSLKFLLEANFQIALIDFEQNRLDEARKGMLELSSKIENPRLAILASMYLARIDMAEHKYDAADQELHKLEKKIPPKDPLSYELSFLQGQMAFETQNYPQAILKFKNSIDNPENTPWYSESMYHLGWSYIKHADSLNNDIPAQAQNLKYAEEAFVKMLAAKGEEKGYLALAQCHLQQAKILKRPEYAAKAEAILNEPTNFHSHDAKAHSLLMRAEAAKTYEQRNALFKELTEQVNDKGLGYANGWYMRALNDFEYANQLHENNNIHKSRQMFLQAAHNFETAAGLLKHNDPTKAIDSLKYQAVAIANLQDEQSYTQAFAIIDRILQDPSNLWQSTAYQDELLYLHGYLAAHLIQNNATYLSIAKRSLQASADLPNSKFGDASLNYLGALYFNLHDYENAEHYYLQLKDIFPNSPYVAEAWLWSARCAELLNKDRNIVSHRRQRVFEDYPDSPFAAEAYFTFYNYEEYLQGDRAAIKHLQNFQTKFTDTPYLIEAYYLTGLDLLRDRKSAEGKWIRKKSLTDAIDSFQHVETLYDVLNEAGKIPPSKKDFYAAMRYRATLHRATSNLAIAEEAQGAKQHIYLEYAEEVFKDLSKDLDNPENVYAINLKNSEQHPNIHDECSFGLAKTYIMANDDKKADAILSKLLEAYQNGNITQGYFPARSWDEKGRIALKNKEYEQALLYFKQAEECAKGNVLSIDQRLDLWIQQSLCYRGMHDYDDAILTLSKVVNDDAISSLRMKAMYLRAETYELQGRQELAKKQLESIAKKGGIWAKKAKEKLERDYE